MLEPMTARDPQSRQPEGSTPEMCEHEWIVHFGNKGEFLDVTCRRCNANGTHLNNIPISGVTLTTAKRTFATDFPNPVYASEWSDNP